MYIYSVLKEDIRKNEELAEGYTGTPIWWVLYGGILHGTRTHTHTHTHTYSACTRPQTCQPPLPKQTNKNKQTNKQTTTTTATTYARTDDPLDHDSIVLTTTSQFQTPFVRKFES